LKPFTCVSCTHPIIPDELGELGWSPFPAAAFHTQHRDPSRYRFRTALTEVRERPLETIRQILETESWDEACADIFPTLVEQENEG
jgi:hypothetical protein